MTGNEIDIEVDAATRLLRITIPGNTENHERPRATLYTKLGQTIQHVQLEAGDNRINLKDIRERTVVLRVETKFQTIVKELKLK